jgi:hypothetical protein
MTKVSLVVRANKGDALQLETTYRQGMLPETNGPFSPMQ